MKHFNHSIHFLWRVTRAAAEYLVTLSSDAAAPPIDCFPEFIAACEQNVDLAWLVHFLADFAFLVLDFKQSVRCGDSEALDLLWREFFSLGHTSTANKTQYIPMSIMRIFWSRALHPDLQKLYHALRSIPMSDRPGSMVGWDCIIEWLNGAITAGVSSHVSLESIIKFIEIYPLLEHNYSVLRDLTLQGRATEKREMKSMEEDVARLKSFFSRVIGSTWQTASASKSSSDLNSHSDARGVKPWDEVHATMTAHGNDSVTHCVATHARNLTRNYYVWQP